MVWASLRFIRSLNMWIWLFLVIAEGLIVVAVVASSSPEARAWSRRHKRGLEETIGRSGDQER